MYQDGWVGNAQDILPKYPQMFDGAVAADVFVYVGDFESMFSAISHSLIEGGWFSYSVEEHKGEGFALQESGRFAHSHSYVLSMLDTYGFSLIKTKKMILRKDREKDIWGRGYLAQKKRS